jgi:hypothetical protein
MDKPVTMPLNYFQIWKSIQNYIQNWADLRYEKKNGAHPEIIVSPTEPINPPSGTIWIDTSIP